MKKFEPDWSKRHYKTCLVDADSILYKASAAATPASYIVKDSSGTMVGTYQRKKQAKDHIDDDRTFLEIDTSDWTIEQVVEDKGLDHAIRVFENLVKGIKREVSADNYRLFIGEGKLDRETVATLYKYKGSREGVEKPKYFYPLKDWVKTLPEVTVIRQIESDDAVSVGACNDYTKNYPNLQCVIACIDKDIKNSNGIFYDYDKGEWEHVTPKQADYNFARQMLTGDWSTDGIKGLPNLTDEIRKQYELPKRNGVGKATADLILKDLYGQSLQTLYERVLECYKSFYGEEYTYTSWDGKQLTKTAEDILDENADLLYMERRKGERWPDYKKRIGLKTLGELNL